MDSEQPVLKPAPPPEAVLIKTGRLASGLGIADAVALLEKRGIHISVSRWSQIENGYQTKGGRYLRVSGGAGQLAHMASVSGVTPDELAQSRPDAARVLSEVLRRMDGGHVSIPKPGIAAAGEVSPPDALSSEEDELAAFGAQIVRAYPEFADFVDSLRSEPSLTAGEKLGLLALALGMRSRRGDDAPSARRSRRGPGAAPAAG
jgi:hypothetical protein